MDAAGGEGRGANGVESEEEVGRNEVHRQEAREKSDTAESSDQDIRGESRPHHRRRHYIGDEGECKFQNFIYLYKIEQKREFVFDMKVFN